MSSSTPSNTSTTTQPDEAAHTLLGESCPKCGNEEAWHGVITEPGERERFACDECGMWLAVTVNKVEPPKPAKAKRPFGLSISIENGQFFLDVGGEPIVSCRPGWYLQIGNITIHGNREAERVEELWADGYRVGKSDAEAAS